MPVKKLNPRGMAATLTMIGEETSAIVKSSSPFNHSFDVRVDLIRPASDQPRQTFDEAEIIKLAETMQNEGLLQPVLLRPDPDVKRHFIMVAGERRWRAARHLGWETILGILCKGDHEVASLVENLQRSDLNIIEEARGLDRLIKGKGWTQTQAAEAIGKAEAEISSTLRILSLPPEILDELLMSKVPVSRYVLAELARVPEGSTREKLSQRALAGDLTVAMIRAARRGMQSAEFSERSGENGVRRSAWPAVTSIALLRVAERLRGLRETRETVGAKEREALLHLREEIDSVLKLSGEPLEA